MGIVKQIQQELKGINNKVPAKQQKYLAQYMTALKSGQISKPSYALEGIDACFKKSASLQSEVVGP